MPNVGTTLNPTVLAGAFVGGAALLYYLFGGPKR
jgi:hypothetical protein